MNGVGQFFTGANTFLKSANNQITLIKAVKYGINLAGFFKFVQLGYEDPTTKKKKYQATKILDDLSVAQAVIGLVRLAGLYRLFSSFSAPKVVNPNILDKIVRGGLYGASYIVPLSIAYFGGVVPILRQCDEKQYMKSPKKLKQVNKDLAVFGLALAVAWYAGRVYLNQRSANPTSLLSFANYDVQDGIRYLGDFTALFADKQSWIDKTSWKLVCKSVHWMALIKPIHSIWFGKKA